MKKYILILATMMLCVMLSAQSLTQKGVSYRYNGKKPRTPLPNVTIECITANNIVISDSTGSFTLTFNKLKMGDRLGSVTVRKREMMVFNQQAVDEWSIRKEPLCLILCDANEFESQKQELINIGKREAQKKYNRQKAELEQQLADNQIDLTRYEAKLDSAWQELDRLHKHIDEYADLFARIDESEIDPNAQQAMDLFNQGKVDDAIFLFEQGNYMEKLRKARAIKKQAQEAKAQIDQAEALAAQDSIAALQSLKAQVEAYKLQNEWEKAGALLKELADELNTYESLYDYALFAKGQNMFKEADSYYHQALDAIDLLTKANPQKYLLEKARIINSLAHLYLDIQNNTWALIWFNTTLLYCEKHSATEGFSAQCDMITLSAINGMAQLYIKTKQYDKSESLLKKVLPILERINKTASKEYNVITVISTVAIIGDYCIKTKDYENAKMMYETCLSVCEMLAMSSPQEYGLYLAGAKENMANFYNVTNRPSESEILFKDAIDILQKYATENPQAYERAYAEALFNLACLYEGQKRINESKKLFEEAFPIFESISTNNPSYLLTFAHTCLSLGFCYSNEQHFTEAITKTRRAISIFKQVGIEKNDLQNDYIQALFLLSLLYGNTNDYQNCYQTNIELIPLLKELYKSNPLFGSQYATILGNQSFYAIYLKQYSEAEKLAQEALQIDATSTLFETNLAASLLFQGKFSEAEAIYRQYKNELKDSFLQDFNDFEAAGVIPKDRKADVERIRKMLMEE